VRFDRSGHELAELATEPREAPDLRVETSRPVAAAAVLVVADEEIGDDGVLFPAREQPRSGKTVVRIARDDDAEGEGGERASEGPGRRHPHPHGEHVPQSGRGASIGRDDHDLVGRADSRGDALRDVLDDDRGLARSRRSENGEVSTDGRVDDPTLVGVEDDGTRDDGTRDDGTRDDGTRDEGTRLKRPSGVGGRGGLGSHVITLAGPTDITREAVGMVVGLFAHGESTRGTRRLAVS
jgi:hypothetical protein